MDISDRNEVINATIKILDRYGIKNSDGWYNQDEEEGAELYESIKAGVVEVYDVDDNEMNDIIDEILNEIL